MISIEDKLQSIWGEHNMEVEKVLLFKNNFFSIFKEKKSLFLMSIKDNYFKICQ